jgi:hypothetical protein
MVLYLASYCTKKKKRETKRKAGYQSVRRTLKAKVPAMNIYRLQPHMRYVENAAVQPQTALSLDPS